MDKELEKFVKDGEKLEDLLRGKLKIIQKEEGYRFSVDPLLLADFVENGKEDKIIDIGTGSAVIPLILAEKSPSSAITGIEIQDDMVDMAKRTIKLNNLAKRIKIKHIDLKNIKDEFKAESFNIVISNPPYIPVKAGKINPKDEKAIARHEIAMSLEDVVIGAGHLLGIKGVFYIVYPASRLIDLVLSLREHDLEPKEIKFVCSNENSAAKLVLIKAVKGGKPEVKISKPLNIYNLEGDYTDEASKILENGKDNI